MRVSTLGYVLPTHNPVRAAEEIATLDLLADHLEKHIDCDRLLELAREPRLRE